MEPLKKEKFFQAVQEAQMILVGIGREFAPDPGISQDQKELQLYKESAALEEISSGEEIFQAYAKLAKLLGHKPYFIVTLNTDGWIWRTELNPECVVAPCGDLRKMQCSEHIVEAAPIRDRVLEEVLRLGKDASQAQILDTLQRTARCPKCGKPLVFHTVEQEGYLEEGYLPQWEKYRKWLQATLNRKLCILELGVGFEYPQVIRWPFEKTAFYNKKASLIRINERFPQIPEKLSERAFSLGRSPVSFLNEL